MTTTTAATATRTIEARGAPSRTVATARKHAAGTVREELVNGVPRLTYEVAEGDTLWSVAQRFAISLEELRTWNRISERKHSLKTGTQLTVWMPGQPQVTSRSGASLLRQAESGHREAGQRGSRAD